MVVLAVREMLAQAPPQAVDLLNEIFSRDLIMGEFVHAMRTTFLASTAVLLVGSVVALLIRSHVKSAAPAVEVVQSGPVDRAEACDEVPGA